MTAPGPSGRGGPTRRQLLTGLGVAAVGVTGAAVGATVGADRAGSTTAAAQAGAGGSGGSGSPGSTESPEVGLMWCRSYLDLIRSNGIPPPPAAQMLAELGLVLHVAATGSTSGATPVAELGQGALRQLVVPRLAADLNRPLVANTAMSYLLTRRYVDSAGPSLMAAAAAAETFERSQPTARRTASLDAGTALGEAVWSWYLTTMLDVGQQEVPAATGEGPGRWELTPPQYDLPVLPRWGRTRTLVLGSAAQVQPPAPMEYSEDPASEFHRQAVAVRDTVAALTEEQLAIARHWSDGKWTINPAGHWLAIIMDEVDAAGADLGTTAEAVLRLGLTQHDAFVSCWWTKYTWNMVRPVTYVRRVLGEPDWLPPVTTPCFPDYTSGHATQSAAAAQVMGQVFGERAFVDASNPDLPERSFDSWRAACEEAAVSRLYGGIHYSLSNEAGLVVGEEIGRRVAALELGS